MFRLYFTNGCKLGSCLVKRRVFAMQIPENKPLTTTRGKLHTTTGYYQGHLVAMKELRARRMSIPTISDLDKVSTIFVVKCFSTGTITR